jgi:hypothetical protein
MQTIELAGDENIAVILNLLQQAKDQDVLLFVPSGCEALERDRVNLQMLRRWADNLALRLGLVIEDRATQVLAREAGFVLLSSLERGQKADLQALDQRRRRRKGLPPRPTASLLFGSATLSKARKAGPRGYSRAGLSLLLVAATFAAVALVLLFVLPSATVVLTPISEPAEATMEMTAVAGLTEINYSAGEIPAATVSVELEGFDTIATTNKRDVPDGYASGSIIFANRTTIPVTITRGTVVRTSFGENVRFYTVADVWLPGELHGTVRVGILAAEPGPSGNVPALTVNEVEGEYAAQVDVLNDSRLSGGTVRRISTVDGVDKANLRAKLSKRLQEEAYGELTSGLQPDDFIPPNSLIINILNEEFDHKVDDITDELGMKMTVRVSGLAISGEEAQQLILSLLQQRTKPGYHLLENSASFHRGDLISATPEEARFRMSVQAATAPAIRADEVSSTITGQTVQGAADYLTSRLKLASQPRIELTGSLLGRLPLWAARIQVEVTTE